VFNNIRLERLANDKNWFLIGPMRRLGRKKGFVSNSPGGFTKKILS
jgi:hypothetical protein